MFSDEELRDKFRGALVGAVVGDCLGAPFEGRLGPVPAGDVERLELGISPLPHTDDTAMTFALAESVLFRRCLDQDHLAATLAVTFERQPDRGYSSQTAALLRHIAAGGPWRKAAPAQSGGQGSRGDGAAMRVAPVALFAAGDLDEALDLADRAARVTHAHPEAVDGARIQAAAVVLALAQDPRVPLDAAATLHRLASMSQTHSLSRQLEHLGDLDPDATADEAARFIGTSVLASDAVPAAVWAVLRSGGSFPDTVRYAIALGGDADTIASMAGAISGALQGRSAIPGAWVQRAEGTDAASLLADRLLLRITAGRGSHP